MRFALAIIAENDPVGVGFRIRVPAVDLRQHGFHFRIAKLVLRIPPVECAKRGIDWVIGFFGFRDQTQRELVNEPGIRAGIAWWVHGFFAPLQKALSICECTILFGVTGCGEKEHFSLDVLGLRLTALHFGRFAPEIRRFNLNHLAHDQPFQFRQCLALEPRVGSADSRVLSHKKHALHFSVEHSVKEFEERMVAGEFGKEAVAEIVFNSCVFPIVSLERADQVLRVIRPETGFFCVVIQILLERLVAFTRHGEITGQNIVQRRDISRTLDRSVTAQCENSAAGPADISKQQLQNRSRANDLHAFGMLCPSDRVTNRSCALRPGCGSERVRHPVKDIWRNAAHFLHHLRRVAREMPF